MILVSDFCFWFLCFTNVLILQEVLRPVRDGLFLHASTEVFTHLAPPLNGLGSQLQSLFLNQTWAYEMVLHLPLWSATTTVNGTMPVLSSLEQINSNWSQVAVNSDSEYAVWVCDCVCVFVDHNCKHMYAPTLEYSSCWTHHPKILYISIEMCYEHPKKMTVVMEASRKPAKLDSELIQVHSQFHITLFNRKFPHIIKKLF